MTKKQKELIESVLGKDVVNDKEVIETIRAVAASQGWDQVPLRMVGLIMWCAFHYYVMRRWDEGK